MINQIGISRGSPLINFLSSADPSSRGPVRRFHIFLPTASVFIIIIIIFIIPRLPKVCRSPPPLSPSLFGNICIFRRIRCSRFSNSNVLPLFREKSEAIRSSIVLITRPTIDEFTDITIYHFQFEPIPACTRVATGGG